MGITNTEEGQTLGETNRTGGESDKEVERKGREWWIINGGWTLAVVVCLWQKSLAYTLLLHEWYPIISGFINDVNLITL